MSEDKTDCYSSCELRYLLDGDVCKECDDYISPNISKCPKCGSETKILITKNGRELEVCSRHLGCGWSKDDEK